MGVFPVRSVIYLEECSPRMRGWTAESRRVRALGRVFPAYAGMDRRQSGWLRQPRRVPRLCGDVPMRFAEVGGMIKCYPYMRGWTATGDARHRAATLSPAPAGMDRAGSDYRDPDIECLAYAGMGQAARVTFGFCRRAPPAQAGMARGWSAHLKGAAMPLRRCGE